MPRVRNSPAWQRARTATLNDWRKHHGNLCPGYQRAAHQADDTNPLTVDHIIPVSVRRDLELDRDNLTVLCRSCNSSKKDRPADNVRPQPTRQW